MASPAPSFTSTNSETEADGGAIGRETRRRLLEWWEKEYCASRMHLAILGKESLDELAELASKYFSPVINRQVDPLPMIHDQPFGPAEKGTMVSVQTIMSLYSVEIDLPIEYQAPYWRHKPGQYIAHLIGHEGPGSVHSYLKAKGWITAISAGPSTLGRGFDMFRIHIQLTKDGLKNYRSVLVATFKYISLLRSSKFEPYLQNENATISDIRFRTLEKRKPDDYVSSLSQRLVQPYPPELLLSAGSITWPWGDEYPGANNTGIEKVYEYLEAFKLENGRVMLMAKPDDLEAALQIGKETTWEKEPWYGTQYRVERFDEDFLRQTVSPNDIPELFLPAPNEFIPTNLDVDKREVAEPAKRPHLIRQTALSTLWHKKDDRFWVPKANVVIDVRSPVSNASPRAAVLTRLFTELVSDSLTEFAYNAELAGLGYACVSHSNGLYVSLRGYNDKMSALVQHVLDKIKNLEILSDRLNVIIEQSKQSWENFFLGQPYQLSDYYGQYMMTKVQWTIDEYLKELPTITPEEVSQHAKKILSDVKMRILVNGNMYRDEAIKVAEIAEAGLGASSASDAELNDHALVLPPSCNLIKAGPVPNPNEPNSALTYFVRIGSIKDRRHRVTGSLLSQIMTEPTFNVLRTKEQLGYVVFCQLWSLPGATEKGIRIVIQSEKTPGYLESRVEAFLDVIKTTLEEMTPEAFEEHKRGLDKKWREEDKNMGEEASYFFNEISTGLLDFYARTVNADTLKEITKDEVYALFMSNVHPSSKTRSKLSVQLRSQKVRPKRVSTVASEAFETQVRGSGIDIVPGAWKDALSDETPSMEAFQKHWTEVLSGKEGAQALLENIPKLVLAHPVDGEGQDHTRSDVTYIGDMKEFRASLQPAEDMPGVEWGDLPISKF